jgi:hypothetical protein
MFGFGVHCTDPPSRQEVALCVLRVLCVSVVNPEPKLTTETPQSRRRMHRDFRAVICYTATKLNGHSFLC